MRLHGRCCGCRIYTVGIISLSIAMWGALRIATAFPTPTVVTTSTTTVILFMATRDGKQRRPKKSESSSSASSSLSTPSTPAASSSTPVAPQRVSNGINIPIRHQIRYGRLNKALREQQQQSTTSGGGFKSNSSFSSSPSKTVRTKYRRTWNEEERDEAAQARRRKGQDPNWELVWNNRTSLAAPLVIVDGYNIIYHWSRLKKHMIKGDTARARQLLIDDLENLRSHKGWRIEVVFDGAGRKGGARPVPLSRESDMGASPAAASGGGPPLGDMRRPTSLTAADRAITKDLSKYGVRIIYTGAGIEADSYIEERCARAKTVTEGRKTGTFMIATDDAMIRIAGESAGALCMSADRFVTELKAVKQIVAYNVEAAMAKVNGQPMRPEKLWGTHMYLSPPSVVTSPPHTTPPKVVASSATTSTSTFTTLDTSPTTSTTTSTATVLPPSVASAPVKGAQQVEDGKFVYRGRFGRGNLIIEDKRKNKKGV